MDFKVYDKVCPICNKSFYIVSPEEYVYKLNDNDGPNKYIYYCSWTCYSSVKYKKSDYICCGCGKPFEMAGKPEHYVFTVHHNYGLIFDDGRSGRHFCCSEECHNNVKINRKNINKQKRIKKI